VPRRGVEDVELEVPTRTVLRDVEALSTAADVAFAGDVGRAGDGPGLLLGDGQDRRRDLPHAEYSVWMPAPAAEALDPPELREAIRVRAQRLANAHGPIT
jgi:hypothetical protein